MRPSLQHNPNDEPIVYSVKTLTALERGKNAMKVEKQVRDNGFIDITAGYFDFHQKLHDPKLTELDAYRKAHDDQLMEIRAKEKKLKIKKRGSMYQKPNVMELKAFERQNSLEERDEQEEQSFQDIKPHMDCKSDDSSSDLEEFHYLDPIQKRQKLE